MFYQKEAMQQQSLKKDEADSLIRKSPSFMQFLLQSFHLLVCVMNL